MIDTLKLAKRLREAGFSDPQAEAVVATVQEGTVSADLASKSDLDATAAALRRDLDASTTGLRNELNTAVATLRSEIREAELRIEAKIEAMKADILNRVFGLILSTLVVNIVAIFGAMFGVAKLLGH